ncbi:MAG: 3-oxoacid CoA-transferase [Dehalococcoidia bacterium]
MNKVYSSAAAAVADVAEGASVMIGGFGVIQGWPSSLIAALRDRGVSDLTAIGNTLGSGEGSPQILAENRQIRRLIASFGASAWRPTAIAQQIQQGEVEFEPVPQGTLVERMRAGGAGLPAFYTSVGVGTPVAKGKERKSFNGREYILETALRADYAFIRAHKADPRGNLVYRRGARNFHPIMAMAADVVIAEVDEVVPLGELDPEAVVTPGIFVHRIVKTEVAKAEMRRRMETINRYSGGPVKRAVGPAGITREMMALCAARYLEDTSYVNLGIGIPTLVSNYIWDRNVTLHAENGVLNYGPLAEEGEQDIDLYNAGGQLVTLRPGASFFHSLDAFVMARGGHLDTVVLGAFQVSERGDLANWWSPHMGAGGIGGAMDLVTGTPQVIIIMEHATRDGQPKILKECTYPLTAPRCVSLVVTDLAVVQVTPEGLVLKEIAPGVTPEEVQALTEPTLRLAADLKEMDF